jgi:uncharacterized cupin superfamily protein
VGVLKWCAGVSGAVDGMVTVGVWECSSSVVKLCDKLVWECSADGMVTGGVWRCSRGVVKLCGKLVADGMVTVGVWQCSSGGLALTIGAWECSGGQLEAFRCISSIIME